MNYICNVRFIVNPFVFDGYSDPPFSHPNFPPDVHPYDLVAFPYGTLIVPHTQKTTPATSGKICFPHHPSPHNRRYNWRRLYLIVSGPKRLFGESMWTAHMVRDGLREIWIAIYKCESEIMMTAFCVGWLKKTFSPNCCALALSRDPYKRWKNTRLDYLIDCVYEFRLDRINMFRFYVVRQFKMFENATDLQHSIAKYHFKQSFRLVTRN